MTVIAISVESGSVSEHFASGLAASLGIELVDQRNIERRIAERNDLASGTCRRLVEELPLFSHRWRIASHQLRRGMMMQILDIAARGNVLIISWVAPVVLCPIVTVLRVSIRAPRALRECNIMRQLATNDVHVARREIDCREALLVRFMRRMFDTDWREADLYDLVLNTERVPSAKCVELVMRLAHSPEYQETASSRADITAQLRSLRDGRLELSPRRPVGNAGAMVGPEMVSLAGIESSEEAIARIERHLHGSPVGDREYLRQGDIHTGY